MTEKLEPINAKKVPKSPNVRFHCGHIRGMREDDKTHMAWMTRWRDPNYPDVPELVVAMLHCGQCAPPPRDGLVIAWRIPYMIVTEADTRRMLRDPGTELEPISEQGLRLVEDEFSKDKKQ